MAFAAFRVPEMRRHPTAPQIPSRSSMLSSPVPKAFRAEDVFSATAARMSAFKAFSSILSPSWKSMARLVFPSRLELKRPEGSSNEAPLAKVIFTTFLYVSPVQIIPACDHTGAPLHFHCSTTSGSDPSEHLAPPIAQLLDSRIYQLRGRVSSFFFLRAAFPLLHGCCRPPVT